MDAYIYAADLYCADCGEDIRSRLTQEGNAPSDPDDETSYDSDEFPKGPYPDGGGESDHPCHCGAGAECLNAIEVDGHWVGAFLENPLTSDGVEYVKGLAAEGPTECVKLWCEHYGIPFGYSVPVTFTARRGDFEISGDVINPGGWFGKAWLIEIGLGYSSAYYVVEADSVSDAIDEFSDSEHGHHIHVDPENEGDYDPETAHYDGSGRMIDLDHLIVHGQQGRDVKIPFPCLYHAKGLPAKGIDPRKLDLYECLD